MPTERQLRAKQLRKRAKALGITGVAIAGQMDVYPTVIYQSFNHHVSERMLDRIEAAIGELAAKQAKAKSKQAKK